MYAKTIAHALGGDRTGSGWIARCPAHDDRRPSLSIGEGKDGTTLIHCHAGCEQRHVIEALRSAGLWYENAPRLPSPRLAAKAACGASKSDSKGRTEAALALWRSASPAAGTLVECYLRSRGLHVTPPATLRFHAGIVHRPSGDTWPAMIALVTAGPDDKPLAIHRTYLARDGAGKADVNTAKMMLGPCRGGAVRLAPTTTRLMVGEGIETCLSAMQAMERPAWAALSASGLKSLDLPAAVREVVVLADGDDTGEAAALECGQRWKREGRCVRIARPPRGYDFNDLLTLAPRDLDGRAT